MHTRLLCAATFLAVAAACNARPRDAADSALAQSDSATAGSAAPAPGSCTPLESRPPEVPDEKPVSPGQTRACAVTSQVAYDVTVVASGLEKPWSVEPMPGGDLLVTEKPGRLRVVTAAGQVGEPITGLPKVDARGQGGLLDVALAPTFDSDRTIYWSFSEPRTNGNATSVARGVLSADRRSLSDVRVIYQTMPPHDGDKHFGSRLVFGPDGMLYVTVGERSDTPMRPQAQDSSSDLGKILRIRPDGTIPDDNPFTNQPNVRPAIWTLGHRNVQAAGFDPQGKFWAVEHGTRGGDELNLIQKGKNYGWPLQAYGMEYSGAFPISSPAGQAAPTRAGTEQPVYYWDPVIAPSGAQWYTGSAFPEWRGNLFVGSLKDKLLVRLVVDNDRVVGEEHLLADRGQRVRDVRQGPDGALYLVTDDVKGELWRIAPRR